MNEDIRTRIALSLVPHIGANRARVLLDRVEKPRDVFKLKASDLSKLYGFGDQVIKSLLSFSGWSQVDYIIKRTEQTRSVIIIPEDEVYPKLLREISDPPVVLWVRGDVNLLKSAGIAVVGTRSPSLYGKDMTQMFTKELVSQNMTIISGLAYGIDTVAHQTALNEDGKTIAVLGSGIDKVYPSSNSGLAENIVRKGGAVISEFPPGTKPDYMNFPTRNRVVSGLSLGVLVVETANEGGSMITARLALEQNRDVFVIPHNLTNSRASGCHKLIRESSGKLVEKVEDIISEYSWLKFDNDVVETSKEITPPQNMSDLGTKCWKEIHEKGEQHLDQLAANLGMPVNLVTSALLELEFSELIRQKPGKIFELYRNAG